MLVVHPNSTCDVCLEGYTNGTNVPHSISCGHIFCLRCLQSLNRLMCPLCRTAFDPAEIRRLHIDRTAQVLNADNTSVPVAPEPESEVDVDVRRLQEKIDHIVLEGASLTDVRNTIDEIHIWLKTQPKDEHRDLRASHRLLHRVTEDREKLANADKREHEYKSRLEAADKMLEDLAQKRKEENTMALAVERSLREHYNRMNAEWNGKYEVVLSECRKLYDEIERLRSESTEGGLHERSTLFPAYDSASSATDVYDAVKTHMEPIMDKLAAAVQEDMFKLSPLPSTLHVPTELPPDSETPEPEFQKKGSGLSEAYTRQSIPAISINPSDASLSGSLLSRRMREHDENMAQSLPQRDEYGSIHRFMASRQPSPPRASSSMAYVPYDPSGDVIMASASVPRGSVLRESKQPPVHTCAEEEQHERWRKELHDLLQLPTNSSGAIREDSDFVPSLSRVGSLSRVRPSSPPRYSGDSSHPAMSRLRAEPLHQGRERSHSEAVYPQSSSSFRFYVSHPPSPPPSTSPTGMASPLSATSMSPTSPGTAQIPRPSLISRASSAAREAETRARERNRKESGGSTTSLSSIASSSSGRTPSALREPTEALSRRSSLANRGPSRSGHTPGIQIIS